MTKEEIKNTIGNFGAKEIMQAVEELKELFKEMKMERELPSYFGAGICYLIGKRIGSEKKKG